MCRVPGSWTLMDRSSWGGTRSAQQVGGELGGCTYHQKHLWQVHMQGIEICQGARTCCGQVYVLPDGGTSVQSAQ